MVPSREPSTPDWVARRRRIDQVSLIASGLVTWQLTRLVLNSWRAEDVAPTPLQTPLWMPQATMALGMALLCFALLRTMIAKARHLGRHRS